MYLNLALVYLNLGPPAQSLFPRDVQEASRANFGAFSDPSGTPWKPKNTVKYQVLAVFHVAAQTSPRTSKSAPKRRPGAARELPAGQHMILAQATPAALPPWHLRRGLALLCRYPVWHCAVLARAARAPREEVATA